MNISCYLVKYVLHFIHKLFRGIYNEKTFQNVRIALFNYSAGYALLRVRFR